MLHFHCDGPHCRKRHAGRFVPGTEHTDGRWEPPLGWVKQDMGDWEVHACCPEHLEAVLSTGFEKTPLTSTDGVYT